MDDDDICTCQRCGGDFHVDDCRLDGDNWYCGDCYLQISLNGYEGHLTEYHQYNPTRLGWFTAKGRSQRALYGVRYYGVELEYEVKDVYPSDVAPDVFDAFHHRCLISDDGSLDHGLEMVTAPADYPTMHGWLSRFAVPDPCRVRNSCGMHVHVSRNTITPLTLGKVLVFVNAPNNDALMTIIARRAATQYCMKYEKSLKQHHLHEYNRYQAINVSSPDTIEFRLFASTRTAWKMCAAIEAVHAILTFCEQASCRALTDADFLEWLGKRQSQYRCLVKLIVRSGAGGGYLHLPKSKPIALNNLKEAA